MTNSAEDDFGEASSSFLNWFTSQPGTSFHTSLQITDLRHRNAGRGIIATSDIPPETDLFAIPRNAIISVETSDLAKRLPELFDQTSLNVHDDEAPLPELPVSWLNLILILLYESFRGSESTWHPYLSILPSDPHAFNTLMFWTDAQLSTFQASAIPSKIGRETATNIFRSQILPVVKNHADIFYGASDSVSHLSDEALLSKCHVIGSLIMSYAFDLQPDDDDDDDHDSSEDPNNDGWTEDNTKPPLMGMVPMADMLNADAEFNAHLSHGDDALTMTSLRTIKAGEEVLNYYGPLPNGELVRRYGYTSPKHARYDVVEIPWDLVRSCLIEEASQVTRSDSGNHPSQVESVHNLLTELEKDEDREDLLEGFIIDRDSGDPNEQGLCTHDAKFERFPDELVEIISEVLDHLLPSKPKSTSKAIQDNRTRDLKRHTISTLQRIVGRRTAQYGTTIPQDEETLSKSDTIGRLKMAVDVRLGEKRLLEEAKSWTQRMLEKYAPPPPSATVAATGTSGSNNKAKAKEKMNGSPPAKRQKMGR